MKRRYILPIIVLVGLTSSAGAAQVTLTDTWQNLGTGPLLITVLIGDGLFEASTTAPTDNGLPILRSQQPFAFNSTTSIWAKRRSTSVSPIATTTPISIGGSGGTSTYNQTVPAASGTGGTSALTLGTAPTANAIPAGGRKSLLITNQSATPGNTVTLCMASTGISPTAPYTAGCYTLQAQGGQLSYPASGYVPQDGFNAVASAASTPVTVGAH